MILILIYFRKIILPKIYLRIYNIELLAIFKILILNTQILYINL